MRKWRALWCFGVYQKNCCWLQIRNCNRIGKNSYVIQNHTDIRLKQKVWVPTIKNSLWKRKQTNFCSMVSLVCVVCGNNPNILSLCLALHFISALSCSIYFDLCTDGLSYICWFSVLSFIGILYFIFSVFVFMLI